MRILYIFPHPDDESFGPAAVIDRQLKAGHEVFLLTLTRGGATKQRHRLGLDIEQMGAVRLREMEAMRAVLGLNGMTVLDFPDNELCELDPRLLEQAIAAHLAQVTPEIVVTYPVHGISGFHDHLVTHATVKRVFLELRERARAGAPGGMTSLRRLAFMTLPEDGGGVFLADGGFRLRHSPHQRIDVEISLTPDNAAMMGRCLDCYATYRDTIRESDVVGKVGQTVYFECFGEQFSARLTDLTAMLPD